MGRIGIVVDAPGRTRGEDLAQGRARLHLPGGKAIELGVAPVGEHHALLAVEQAQALGHVVDGSDEPGILRLELLLALLEKCVLPRQLRAERLPLADVLMRHDPAAVAARAHGSRDDPAVGQLVGEMAYLADAGALDQLLLHPLHVFAGIEAIGDAVLDDLAQGRAGLHLLGSEAVQLGIGGVGDDDAAVGIEHGETLHHVVEGGVELLVLRPQHLLLRLEQSVLLLETGVQLLALGDVGMG